MKRHISIILFSPIGDIAIASPLVRAYAEENPDIKFTVVAVPMTKTLFDGIGNLSFISADFKGINQSFLNIPKLRSKLVEIGTTDVADFCNTSKSRALRYLLSLKGIHGAVIWKSRFKQKALTRRHFKIFQPIATAQRRYEKIFSDLGLHDLNFSKIAAPKRKHIDSDHPRIGIAPFAKHCTKMWPVDRMEGVVSVLSSDPKNRIFLFAGKKREASLMQKWQDRYDNVESVAGKHILSEELEIMKSLDVMVCMDSANMHLASCVHVPVISIWGATHPYAGFYGWQQDPTLAIQISLPCRPCSIDGSEDCFRKDMKCLDDITTDMVLDKIDKFLHNELN